jgi:hypothetical protein
LKINGEGCFTLFYTKPLKRFGSADGIGTVNRKQEKEKMATAQKLPDTMAQLLKGIATAQISQRQANPAQGTAWYLLNKTSLEVSKKKGNQYVKRIMTCVRPISDSHGREIGQDNYQGELKGTTVSYCIFQGKYFHKDVKEFILKSMGRTATDEAALVAETIAELKEADPAFRPAADETEADAAWSAICALVFGIGADTGCLDGSTVLELETKERVKNTDKYVKDAAGNLVPEVSVFVNTYIKRRVPLAEVAANVEAKDLAKFFGSIEQFNLFLKAESEG